MIKFDEMLCCNFDIPLDEKNEDVRNGVFVYNFALSLLHVLAHKLVIADLKDGVFKNVNEHELACSVDIHTLCVRIDSGLSQSVVDSIKLLADRIISATSASDVPQIIPAMIDVLDEVMDSSGSELLKRFGHVFVRNQAILRTFVYKNVRNSCGFERVRELIMAVIEKGPSSENLVESDQKSEHKDEDSMYYLDPSDPDSGTQNI